MNLTYQFLKEHSLKVHSYNNAFSSQFDRISAQSIPTPIPQENAHCKVFTTGCIYDSKGSKIALSERLGGYAGDLVSTANPVKLSRPMQSSPKIKGNTLFIGVWMNHYGHFITETLSRLWLYKDIKNYDNLVTFAFVFDNNTPIKNHQAYFLHLLNIPSKEIRTLREPVRFEKITIPEQGWIINHSINKNIKPLYEQIRNTHISSKSQYTKIFLSRNDASYQRINNVFSVEKVFKAMGYSILYPDKLPIQDQLIIYANCKIMAGFSGSALHNCLFTQEDTFVIELADRRTRNKFHPMQKAALELSGNHSHLISYQVDEYGNYDTEFIADNLSSLNL